MDYLSLCLICKDENDYLSEWLDYHILMGVERFYIYDNGSRISLRDSLQSYIEQGWVIAMDIPGQSVQLYAYDHCLQTFGAYTRWLGFIDTDEFLVPKTSHNLKEFLRDYEAYGGLAVSSLFFGSSGHKERPADGQIASYTYRTHQSFHENTLIKCIVQPDKVLMPYSPHDFIYKENFWCVNESFLRVDNQEFPNHINNIQLNHYFCRSAKEIDIKLRRGRGDNGNPWQRRRFDVINRLATFQDTSILQVIEALHDRFSNQFDITTQLSDNASLLEKIASLSKYRQPTTLEISIPARVDFREEITKFLDFEAKFNAVKERGDHKEICLWIQKKIQIFPQRAILYVDLAICYINLNDPENAWQMLGRAWQLAPNSYSVLFGMVFYFLKIKNHTLAEKTCHLLLEMAPNDLTALGFMTEAMIGQGRMEEALKIGEPVVTLAATLDDELPAGMAVFLIKKMADYLIEINDFAGALRLWYVGVKLQPEDGNLRLELGKVLLMAGDKISARQQLIIARDLAPKNEMVHNLLRQAVTDVDKHVSNRRRH